MNWRCVVLCVAIAGSALAADINDLTAFVWPPGALPLPAGVAVTVPGPDGRDTVAWQITAESRRRPMYEFPWRAGLPGVRYHVSLWMQTKAGPTPAIAIQDTDDKDWRGNWYSDLSVAVETRGKWERREGWFTPSGDEPGRWRLVLSGPAGHSEFLVTGIEIRPELPAIELPDIQDAERLLQAAAEACRAARQAADDADRARIRALLELGAQ